MSVLADLPSGVLVTDSGIEPDQASQRNARLIVLLRMLSMSANAKPDLLGLVQTVSAAHHFFPQNNSMRDAVEELAHELGLSVEVVVMNRGSEVTQ